MEKIQLYAGTSENPAVLVDNLFIGSENLTGADNQQERLELCCNLKEITKPKDLNSLYLLICYGRKPIDKNGKDK